MGEIRPKKCEGRELTKDQLAGDAVVRRGEEGADRPRDLPRAAQDRRLQGHRLAAGARRPHPQHDEQGAPKPLITPIFPAFFRFFPVSPGTSGRALWIPGVQTLKMGEKWGKMGKKWVRNEITGLQKTVLMHASAHLAGCAGGRGG